MTPEEIAKLPYRPCAGVMLLNAAGKVFVGQRKDRYTDAWQAGSRKTRHRRRPPCASWKKKPALVVNW